VRAEGVLGVAKFGVRRKLHARLQALKTGAPPPPPRAPVTAAPAPAPHAGAAVVTVVTAPAQQPAHQHHQQQQAHDDEGGASGAGAGASGSGAGPSAPPPPSRAGADAGVSGSGAGPSSVPPPAPLPPVLGAPAPAPRAGADAGAFAAAHDPALAADAAKATRQLQAEAACVGAMQWCAARFRKTLDADPAWAPPLLRAARLSELARLEAKCVLPGMTVVVVGNTGAGKSTLLNALLGETGVLPTNGMRACTAALIELSHNPDASGPAYAADVEFITAAEWAAEEEALFEDLTQQDGRAVLGVSDPNAHNYVSFCRLYAVYGDAYTHSRIADANGPRGPDGRVRYINPTVGELRAKLARERRITGALGTVRHMAADDARSFRRMVEAYVDSSNEASAMSFWPLVRRVRMRGRKWDLLKTGAILVDGTRAGHVRARLRASVFSHSLFLFFSSLSAWHQRRQQRARRHREDVPEGRGFSVDRVQHQARRQRQERQGHAGRVLPPPAAHGWTVCAVGFCW
jgi:energy-coupling factor transporter ATP-binding protein EcfA2